MSTYINRYYQAETSFTQKDGPHVEIVYCDAFVDNKLHVYNKNRQQYLISISDIKQILPNLNPPKYFPDYSTVEYYHIYHQLDGACATFGKIISHNLFYNDITYIIENFETKQTETVRHNDIVRIATLKSPKYSVGEYVSVVTVYSKNQFIDDIRENCTILSLKCDYTKVIYTVKTDSGLILNVQEYSISTPIPPPKTHNEIEYEEERLMKELEKIRL